MNPETIRDQFGVIEVVPADSTPTNNKGAIKQLYWTWLAYITRQLNQRRPVNVTMFNLLPEDDKLFGIVTTGLRSNGRPVRMAVPPAFESVFQDAVDDKNLARGPRRKVEQLKRGIRDLNKSEDFGTENPCPYPTGTDFESRDPQQQFPLYDRLARSYRQNFPILAVTLSNLIDLSHSGEIDVSVAEIESILVLHREAFVAAQEYVRVRISGLNSHKKKSVCKNYLTCTSSAKSNPILEKFGQLLNDVDRNPTLRVLDVTPAERAQQVSTLASAAASLQTALSIATALPTAGVGINAGFSNLKTEIGKIEARERVPLVVGFIEGGHSETTKGASASTNTQERSPRFGWVLGPQLRPDLSESRLKHSQSLRSHELQVDLSLPAWWPSVELSVRTAWAGPLGKSVERSCAECVTKTFKVTLPRSDSHMEALTQFLFLNLSIDHAIVADRPRIVSDRPKIVEVSPSSIDRNAGQVTLIVQGSGLWRGEEVFVYGVRQTNVTVLPDMSGLAVTLNPSSLPLLNPETDMVPLAVFTRAGKAVFPDLQLIERQTVSASALALVPVLPYHTNKTSLELRPRSGSFPLGTSPKIAFRPSVEGQNYKFEEIGATLTASRSVASATVNWTDGVKMVSGDTLAVSYLYQPDEHTAPVWSEEVSFVYYKDKDEAAVAFDNAEVMARSTNSVRVGLKLPKRAAEAYPLIFDAETKVKATAGTATLLRNGGRLEVTVTPPEEGFEAGKITLEFTNPKAGTGALPEINGMLTVK